MMAASCAALLLVSGIYYTTRLLYSSHAVKENRQLITHQGKPITLRPRESYLDQPVESAGIRRFVW
jgi:hypothetical protein